MSSRPRIAMTCAIIHEDPERKLFKGKALHFSEQKMGAAVWRGGGLPLCVPAKLKSNPYGSGSLLRCHLPIVPVR